MTEVSPSLISTWGAWAVFASVLATQLGVPIPAAPVLLLAGAAVSAGLVSFWYVLAGAVFAVILADCIWFTIGRLYGRRVLTALVRISLSLDSSIKKTREWFERFGAPILSVSKFVPGLGLIAPPLLGTTLIDKKIFLAWDLAGALAWSGFWLLGGALFRGQLTTLMSAVRAHGASVMDVLGLIFVSYFLYRWIQRLRFRRWLAHIRISPVQLDAMMRDDRPPVILDARPAAVRKAEPHRIPGAILLDLSTPDKVDAGLLEHDIVVYCVCPNEATAKQITRQMHKKGFKRIRALKGGLDAWEHHGYPVEPLPSQTDARAEPDGIAASITGERDAVTLRAVAPKDNIRKE
ncbi:membrane protein DedA, SNARE-associated domain [Burkholderia sp. WP9]|uniref:DedA family protein/thiosulfate sulfurtransferase GlpE n=1 Tax=Burkholderia sp. WP9 TaxID=1500263 RepID=UPI00089C5924|nr:DedA family protein/thiosulfate sulfurtransferase GlpE [Burkholderia sp. WP9]SEF12672.1 membrane protein DedA, SNARE-associated domain [Burkholderia sp. WP9]